jgi:NAD(P)-dependent dehydrogenase (short-subunit alcohol dehydrogenase family)
MACRNLKRANQAATRIRAETKNQGVFVEQLDLADLASIRSFAERFKSKFGRLDILINNAGKCHTFSKIVIQL